jgi:hypothetical protein
MRKKGEHEEIYLCEKDDAFALTPAIPARTRRKASGTFADLQSFLTLLRILYSPSSLQDLDHNGGAVPQLGVVGQK